MRSVIDRADRVGSLMGEVTSPDAESSVPTVSERVKERGAQAVEVLRQLNSSLVALYEAASEVRFRSSMMRLHTLMAGIFAAAVWTARRGSPATPSATSPRRCSPTWRSSFPPARRRRTWPAPGGRSSLRGQQPRPRQAALPALDPRSSGRGGPGARRGRRRRGALSEAVAVGEQGFPETASLAELAARPAGVVVTLDEPVIRQRVATVRETLSHLGE